MTQAANPNFVQDVTDSFHKQSAMRLIRAKLAEVTHGKAEIHLEHWDGIEQQHGFVHGGVVGMIADSAAGYAAMSVCAPGDAVLTIEYKINTMSPAVGDKLIACGEVLRHGRTIIVTKADVFAEKDGKRKLCAVMQQTIMVVHDRKEK